MTQRLYEEDAYCRQFTATVQACEQRGDVFALVLDRTAFFPEGGGQTADGGTLNGLTVLDVQLEGDTIYHYVPAALSVGEAVVGELDWPVRFLKMQKHTGEHIVSGLVYAQFGYTNCGFHLGSEDVTLDFDGELTREQLDEIEMKANEVIWQNVSVVAEYPSADTLETLSYRSKKPIDGPVRIVTIDGYDACACCAPHVARTGEVGVLKLLDAIRYKGGMRIHMQCGADAVLDYRARYTQTASIAAMLSVKQADALSGVERLAERCALLERNLKQAQEELAVCAADGVEPRDGVGCLFLAEATPDGMRKAAQRLAEKSGNVGAVFVGNDVDGYRFSAVATDTSALMAELRQRLSARGGGNAQAVQGSVACKRQDIEAFFAS